MIWEWVAYRELSIDTLYDIMVARQEVFIIEQRCPYLDADGIDRHSHHLIGRGDDGKVAAYLRVVHPGARYAEPSIGRVLTSPVARGTGAGAALLREGIRRTLELYPGAAIRIAAQRYLLDFYGRFGFVSTGYDFDEDGIPHTEMLRPAGM